ncbi:5e64f466-5db1-46c5-aa7f-0a0062be32f8 [Sclerotinia trifoliorum]|uniref:5e64f466-5db1-46c5-aa7f-0a0062be32f8 n=1 Tax=Sclerotinia trifoliorum TaxID=28548 RepID=A0A8H2VP35_9HELO|nr:5e64f466-5db1-46c5-aa7f-0a0062be32f8 [Sclerotinia trifoliorum]
MAVLDSLPGIEVTMCVDGESLKEYENNEHEAMLVEPEALDEKFEVVKHQRSVTVKKFVESEAGKLFSIRCAAKDPYRYTGACTHITFECLVDGEIVTGGISMSKDEYEEYGFSYNDVIMGNIYQEQGQELLQRFQFIKTRMIDDNPISEATDPYERTCLMGKIEVRVFRMLFIGYAGRPNNTSLTTQVDVPERMLKGEAKSHSTLFGKGEVIEPRNYADAEFCGGGVDYPIAIFKFQYGSKEDLESLGVIKRCPEPKIEPEFCFCSDLESVLKPISEPQTPKMPLLDIKVERELLQKTSHAESTSSTPVDTFVCSPLKQELQEADRRNPARTAPTQPVISPNHLSPPNPENLNIQTLNPTQTGQLIGQIGQPLQLLQGQVGQPAQVLAHTPASFRANNTAAATPTPPVSASSSSGVNVSTSDPPIKREREQSGSRDRKRRRKPRGKVTIDLTEDDSDDNIVIDLDSD